MAFPVIRDQNHSFSSGTNADDPVSLPTHVAGDLLIVFYRLGTTTTPNTPVSSVTSGWAWLDAGDNFILYKVAASSVETLTITRSTNLRSSAVSVSVSGVDTANAPFLALQKASSADFPSVTAPWGANDNLFFACYTTRGRLSEAPDESTYAVPANYTFVRRGIQSGSFSTAYAFNVLSARNLAAASDDPASVEGVMSSVPVALTLVVKPLGGGGPVAISFSGTVPTLNGTEGVAFSQSVASYFDGTETPFSYAKIAGDTLPSGWSFDADTATFSNANPSPVTISGIVIRATDDASNTADTNAFSIVIAAAATPPTGTVTISNVTPGVTSATVTYSYNAADQTGFEYRIDNEPAASLGASPATITGLTANTTYDAPGLEIRAINPDGAGAWSSPWAFATQAEATAPAAAPGSFTANADSSTRIDLSWSAVDGATGYEVEINAGAPVDVGDNLGYAHTGLAASTPYDYRVRAYNGAGAGPWSATVSESTLAVSTGDLRLRFVIDSAIGVPMASTTFPTIVVYDASGYQAVTATFAAPVSDSAGVITLPLGDPSGYSYGAGDWVWVGCAQQVGTPGVAGYEINGILTRVLVEEYNP